MRDQDETLEYKKTWSQVSNSSYSKIFVLASLDSLKYRSYVFSLQRSSFMKFMKSKKILGQKKNFGPKKIMGQKKTSGSKKNLGLKKDFGSKKIFY